ncbi:MAG: hypothetical protein QM650_03000 [Microlunatus sp.]
MDRYPTPDEVLANLGDKATEALSGAVVGAREDLAVYRAALPQFVAEHSGRGLANWIHDRMWARVVAALEGVDGVVCLDSGPNREIAVRMDFRIRLKRHSSTGAIRNYPTANALDFITQEPDLLTLLGIMTLNISVGYEWDEMTRSMGNAVISLRDGSFEDVIWMVDLPAAPAAGGAITPIVPTDDGPVAPVVEATRIDSEEREGTSDS